MKDDRIAKKVFFCSLKETVKKKRGRLTLGQIFKCGCRETRDFTIKMGCLIKGETPHFDFIAESVTQGLMNLMLHINIPVVNGILTVYSNGQAVERLGGSHGHKGKEAAETALQMLQLKAGLNSTAI